MATTTSRSPRRNKNRTVLGTDNQLLCHRPQHNNNISMWCQYPRCGGMDKIDQWKRCWKNSRNGIKVSHSNRVKVLQHRKREPGSHIWPTKIWIFPTGVKVNSRNRLFTTWTNLWEKSICDLIKISIVHTKVPNIWHPSQIQTKEDNPSCRCPVKSMLHWK